MSSYKLTYFNLAGRAEPIRWIFSAAGVPYEDYRIQREEWPKVKPNTPWGKLPVLEVNGNLLAQTVTISRYLAHKFNLTGKDEWEAAKCDEFVDAATDLFAEYIKFFMERDEYKKEKLKEELIKTHCPQFLTNLNSVQIQNGGLYLASSELTWGDIYIAELLQKLQNTVNPEILREYPNVRKMKEAVENNPNIKQWLNSRPRDWFVKRN